MLEHMMCSLNQEEWMGPFSLSKLSPLPYERRSINSSLGWHDKVKTRVLTTSALHCTVCAYTEHRQGKSWLSKSSWYLKTHWYSGLGKFVVRRSNSPYVVHWKLHITLTHYQCSEELARPENSDLKPIVDKLKKVRASIEDRFKKNGEPFQMLGGSCSAWLQYAWWRYIRGTFASCWTASQCTSTLSAQDNECLFVLP